MLSAAVENLVAQLTRLPGVGSRTAHRFAFHLLRVPEDEALERVMVDDWGMRVALGRLGRPEELGDVIAFLLSERSSYLTGALINVDGGTASW